jgi:hypothetical protein
VDLRTPARVPAGEFAVNLLRVHVGDGIFALPFTKEVEDGHGCKTSSFLEVTQLKEKLCLKRTIFLVNCVSPIFYKSFYAKRGLLVAGDAPDFSY